VIINSKSPEPHEVLEVNLIIGPFGLAVSHIVDPELGDSYNETETLITITRASRKSLTDPNKTEGLIKPEIFEYSKPIYMKHLRHILQNPITDETRNSFRNMIQSLAPESRLIH
jgi:hypothetical protein